MKQRLVLLWALTVASMKMYFRNRTGLFFTLFFPIVLIFVFGFLSNGDGKGAIKISLTNHSQSQLSKSYVEAVKKIDVFKVTDESNETTARDQLGKGKIDLEVVISKDFGEAAPKAVTASSQNSPSSTASGNAASQTSSSNVSVNSSSNPTGGNSTVTSTTKGTGSAQATAQTAAALKPSNIQAYFNEGRPGNGQTAGLILGQVASQFNNQLVKAPQIIGFKSDGVKTNNLGFIDFILPGILAMTIMQVGIFSVAFSFISYKTSGALRRIQATPINASNFLIAQSITRYIVTLLQLALLTAIGIYAFHLHLLGSLLDLWVVVTLGVAVFLAMGFAVAGRAKDENQVAPLAQLLQLPQLFLSGVFFPRDNFPHWLATITNYLPLTYLSDAVRAIFNEGANLYDLRIDVLGLIVWGVIAYVVADRIFKWE